MPRKFFSQPFGPELRTPIDGYSFKRTQVFESHRCDGIQFTNKKIAQLWEKDSHHLIEKPELDIHQKCTNDEREVSLWKPYSDNGSFRFR